MIRVNRRVPERLDKLEIEFLGSNPGRLTAQCKFEPVSTF